jgi:hypothetical protein
MPNPIKYSTGSETLALKKGNLYIGTGAVGKGPSETTGYYQGPNVPSGGYVIYMNREGAPGNLSYHSAANDAQLISFTNSIAGQSYTGVNQCFDYYYSQNDKVLVNQDYPADYPYIVMDNLVLYLDAGITQSYLGSGTTWTDVNGLGPKNNGTLTNGPTFNSDNGGSIVFDGTDDYVIISDSNSLTNTTNLSICVWVNFTNKNRINDIIGKGFGEPDNNEEYTIVQFNDNIYFDVGNAAGPYIQPSYTINNNTWYHIVCTHERISNTSYLKLYVNGVNVPANVNAAQNTPNNNNSPVTLGRRAHDGQPYGNRNLDGKIAITQIYTKTLSEVEVLQNYNAQKSRFGL